MVNIFPLPTGRRPYEKNARTRAWGMFLHKEKTEGIAEACELLFAGPVIVGRDCGRPMVEAEEVS